MWKFFTGTQRDLKARPGKVATARKRALVGVDAKAGKVLENAKEGPNPD